MPPFENFLFPDRPVKVRCCEAPGCSQAGDYRAPKNRELSEHYWFCLTHVREYNLNWDYFSGMSPAEVENYNRKAGVWERPSWPLGEWRNREQNIRDQVMREFFSEEPNPSPQPPMAKSERDALTVLELQPPVNFIQIKTQYKILVKRHHPDANGGSHEAEERFKSINQAFTILKQIYIVEETA